MERGVYTAEELAAVEAVPLLRVAGGPPAQAASGWRRQAGATKPVFIRRTVWTVQRSNGSWGEDLYSAGAAREWAATYRAWNPTVTQP